MGQIIIEVIRNAPFLEKAQRFVGDMDDPPTNQKPEPYFGKLLPGVRQKVSPVFSMRANSFQYDGDYLMRYAEEKEIVGENAVQRALDDLVRRCELHDDNGNQITRLNLGYMGCPFLTHRDLHVVLEDGKAVLDEGVAKNRLMAAFFFADSRFKRVDGDTDKSFSAFHQYEIGLQEDMERLETQDALVQMDVGGVLAKLERPKMLLMAQVLNINIPAGMSDKKLKAILYTDIMRGGSIGSERKAEWAVKYGSLSQSELSAWVLLVEARSAMVIRNTDDRFEYNGVNLGSYEQNVVTWMMSAANENLVSEIRKAVKTKSKRKLDFLESAKAEPAVEQK